MIGRISLDKGYTSAGLGRQGSPRLTLEATRVFGVNHFQGICQSACLAISANVKDLGSYVMPLLFWSLHCPCFNPSSGGPYRSGWKDVEGRTWLGARSGL